MADNEHLEILRQGVRFWNQWRQERYDVRPDLSGADLTSVYFRNLSEADLRFAVLDGANMKEANLFRANLYAASLTDTDLTGASLGDAVLTDAVLYRTNLRGVSFYFTNLTRTYLVEADFESAIFAGTIMVETQLTNAKNLNTCIHEGRSYIDYNTLLISGQLPHEFLRGCGLPEGMIKHLPEILEQAREFSSCFISYSHKDEEFAKQLYERMLESNIQVWYAPEDVRGGQKLHEQIDRAIQLHEKLIIVLSENSLTSEWAMTEIRKARKAEIKDNRRKLFPIRLVSYDAIREWECFDADIGKDLAVEVREYYIPDFSSWQNPDDFERAYARLIGDLRLEA